MKLTSLEIVGIKWKVFLREFCFGIIFSKQIILLRLQNGASAAQENTLKERFLSCMPFFLKKGQTKNSN